MKVTYSRLALAELEDILERIAAENPAAAIRVRARIERVIERIEQFPEGAQQVAERPSVRRVPLVRYPYVIHYRVAENEIIILRIIHGARRSPWL